MTHVNDKTNQQLTKSYDKPADNGTFEQDMDELERKANSSLKSASDGGSSEISGSAPNLESDDDVLQNAHEMGIALNADFENPTELNLAKDIEEAEKLRRDS